MRMTHSDVVFYEQQIRTMKDAIERYERLIEEYKPIVKVAYLPDQAFDYIDDTDVGLKVGDLVNAPTRYKQRNTAVVVLVGGPRTYQGPLKKIREIMSR